MRRRDFLTTVAAAGLLPQVTGRAAAAAAAPVAAAPEQLKLGVASYSLRKFPFDKALEMAKACDVHYINFKDVHLRAHRPTRRDQGRARQDRGRRLHHHGRRYDHVGAEGRKLAGQRHRAGAQGLRVRQARRHAAHRRGAELRSARHRREDRQGVRYQGRDSQSRPGGQVLPVAVRRLQAREGPRQAHGALRRHRPHVARRRRPDQGGPRAARPRLRSARERPAPTSRIETAR